MIHIKRLNEMMSGQYPANTINEGAGAGYNIMINGLVADTNTLSIDINNPLKWRGETFVRWSARLLPSKIIEWATASYYDAIDSENIGWETDYRIKGGEVRGFINASMEHGIAPDGKIDTATLISVLANELRNYPSSISTLIGAGWQHENITNPIEFGEIDSDDFDDILKKDFRINRDCDGNDAEIYYASVNAPEFAKMINSFYKNPAKWYKE